MAATVVGELQILGPKAERAFFLVIWLPAVLTAGAIGGLLKMLGPVARKDKSALAAAVSMKAEEWHTREQCKDCGFMFEVGDAICQCPVCAGFFHVRCWNDVGGCGVCLAAGHGSTAS